MVVQVGVPEVAWLEERERLDKEKMEEVVMQMDLEAEVELVRWGLLVLGPSEETAA